MTDLRARLCPALTDAIERLYVACTERPAPHALPGCPCCTSPALRRLLATEDRRTLSGDAMDTFAFKALTTLGTPEHLRWLAPRLLELAVGGQLGVDDEIVLGKLGRGRLVDWPASERAAVEAVLWEGLIARLADADLDPAESWLCGLACALPDLRPWLARLDADPRTAVRWGVRRLRERDAMGHARSGFWSSAGDNAERVRQWLATAPCGAAILVEEPGLFAIEVDARDQLWITVDVELGGGAVGTCRRALTQDETRAVLEGDASVARALAWQIADEAG